MSGTDASELVVAGTGSLHVAPYGTTIPTTVDAALDGNFFNLGFLTEDGLQKTQTPTIEEFPAWQSRFPIRRELTGLEVMLTAGLLQWNEQTLQTALGGGSVTEYSSGKYVYVPVGDDEQLDEVSVVASWSDGDDDYRLVIPKASATESVEVQLNRTNASVLPVTFKVLGVSGVAPYKIYTNAAGFEAGS